MRQGRRRVRLEVGGGGYMGRRLEVGGGKGVQGRGWVNGEGGLE